MRCSRLPAVSIASSMKALLFFSLSIALFVIRVSAQEAEPVTLPRPLVLEAALTLAVEHSPGLLRVREQIREEEGVLVTARAARLPSVVVSGAVSRTDEERLETREADDKSWMVQTEIVQTLYAGGEIDASVRAQREQVAAARLVFEAALHDTVFLVRQQFYAILLNRELIRVQEDALRVLENEQIDARSRRDRGTGSDFDLLRAEVAVANAKPALIRARNAYHVAQDRLRSTLGVPSSMAAVDLEIEGSLLITHRATTLEEALAVARVRRPEIEQQERLHAAAEYGVDAARSGYLPTVIASAGYAWLNSSFITTHGDLHGWSAGLRASWNVFDGKATAGQMAQARSRERQIRHTMVEVKLAVELDVRTAHASVLEAEELLHAASQVMVQAQESLRLSQSRLRSGVATQLDVLSAQSALTEARSNLAQAEHAYAVGVAMLDRAIGATSY